LATVLRLVAVFNFGTYMFDDMFSVHFTSKPVPEMFYFLKDEVHPPIFYLLLNFWVKIFNGNEITNRILPLIFNIACIPLVYFLGKKILNKWIGILASLFFALSYFQIFTSAEIRMYSLMTFLGLASLSLFWLIVVEKKKGFWLLYTLINILTLLTHLGGLFALLTQWLWFFILLCKKQIDSETARRFLIAQVSILAVWSIWLIPFFLPKLIPIITKGWYFKIRIINRSAAIGLFDNFFLLLENSVFRFIVGVIIFSAPFMILLWNDKKLSEKMPAKINPNWFLLTWALPAYLVSVITRINFTRIYLIAYVGFYLIVAYFLYILFKNLKKTFWIIFIILIAISGWNLIKNVPQSFSAWNKTNDWLMANEKPGDKIIIYRYANQLQFENYYTGRSDYEGVYPIDDKKTLEQRIVENNWQHIVTEENINYLEKATDNYDRIIVIHETPPPDIYWKSIIHYWLEKNGWSVIEVYQPGSFLGPKVVIYSQN